MDTLLLSFVVMAFLACVLAFEGGYLLWNAYRGPDARRIQQRLHTLSAGGRLSADSQILKQRLLSGMPAFERLLLRIPRVQSLDRALQQSGLGRTLGRWLAFCAFGAALGFVAWLLLRLPAWTAPLWMLGAAALPALYVLRARRKRLRALERQLPDALDLMARALRAGHAFPSALQMVGAEGPEPIAGEFALAFDESNYGVPMPEALSHLARRVPVADLRFFVIAVAIQRETGGNLAELLDTLAALMRARFKLLGTIRVLSTEGRLSGWILTLLPIVLLLLINLLNPKFMSILWTDPAGMIAIWMGSILMLIGVVWLWSIVKIRI